MVTFENPATWPPDDSIGSTVGLTPELAVHGYRHGLFPMPISEELMGWFSPMWRGILPLDQLRVTRSMRQSAKKYAVTVDLVFPQVLARCADPNRPHGWIDRQIAETYATLHQHGIVHSVEVWDGHGRLCGGLYGVNIGGLFAGESMFHDPLHGRDASKVALMTLVEILTADGVPGRLLDVQWRTDHLASLGVVEVPRARYLEMLPAALALPAPRWPVGD
ncbi:MAG: leucyl/phenylalanyl-tRNA--protein transferase [Propionibacteriaceae bacterium]|nr:leucyl/phenylalanyl-tRNA--protein transferase [Propionibacteriaceae bacterium]